MKLGMFMMPIHPPARPIHETHEENIEKAVLADTYGYEELWVGEHYTAKTDPIISPLMFMSALLDRTRKIKFCTGVINLPLHHPAAIAAEIAYFDQMSKGRLIFGIGPGGLVSDMELFGNLDTNVRNEKTAESIDMILKLWAQDPPYDIKGKYWSILLKESVTPEAMGHIPKPYQQPHPPIASSAMSPNSDSVRLAVLKGWIPISANFSAPWVIRSHGEKYLEGCTEIGREPTGDDWRVARNILIADSDAEARDHVRNPASSLNFYFNFLYGVLQSYGYGIIMRPHPEEPEEKYNGSRVADEMTVHGSVKTVLDKLVAFRDDVGPFGTLLQSTMDWSGINDEAERKSMRLLVEEVMPKLNQHIAATRHPWATRKSAAQ